MLFTMSLREVACGSKQVNGGPNEVTWGLDYLGPQEGKLVVKKIIYSNIISFMRDKRSINTIEVLD